MPCYSPLNGWKSRAVSKTGRRQVVFDVSQGYRDLPVQVPCGQCVGCRIDRVSQWVVRLTHEAQLHDKKSFLTLTYAPDKLPEGGSLMKRDLQLFMKRLRSAHGGTLRFFDCGEYGENFGRPHYHMILFGVDFADRIKFSTSGDNDLYTSPTLDKLWGLGHCLIGSVTPDSCRYVASYIFKKFTGEDAARHYERVDLSTGEIIQLQPEFVTMSRRPGIGAGWYGKFSSDLYPDDFSVVFGRKLSVPKYYDKQLDKADPALLEKLKLRRVRKAAKRKADNTPERLAVRREVALSKLSLKQRSL